MNEQVFDISHLLVKQIRQELSDAERITVQEWADSALLNKALLQRLNNEIERNKDLAVMAKIDKERARRILIDRLFPGTATSNNLTADIQSADNENAPDPFVPVPKVHRIHFLKTAWFKYAAAILIITGTAAYLWNTQKKENRQGDLSADVSAEVRSTKEDVPPGGNRAVLTLANGRKIVLDSAANGKIATQDNATITKNGDRLIYQAPQSRSLSTLTYNTMTTPRGGQYQLTLPDGSQVWLNAESSITYPTAFTGNKREVTVTGEVYFEVTKDALKPFIVHPERANGAEGSTEQPLRIEVLGTHFNINAYNEEPIIKTTLLEGSVKLTRSNNTNSVLTSLTLKPGQQGQLTNDQKLSLAVKPDLEQVMAWKNGIFHFNNQRLPEVLTQLSRWYDVDIAYEGAIPDIKFIGKMGRDLTLSQVLNGFQQIGVKFRIEGKKLIVSK